jgi:hypothetical protein
MDTDGARLGGAPLRRHQMMATSGRRICNLVRMASIVSTAVLLAACATTIDGTPKTAPGPHPIISPPTATPADSPLTSILPDAAQWSAALGYHVHLDGWQLRVEGVEGLGRQDVLGEWSEQECVGVVLPLLKSVFGGAPVRAVVGTTVSDVTAGAVQLASPADAQALFNNFADQWQRCNSKTVVQQQGSDTFLQDITNVVATDTVVSATVMGTVPPNPPAGATRPGTGGQLHH